MYAGRAASRFFAGPGEASLAQVANALPPSFLGREHKIIVILGRMMLHVVPHHVEGLGANVDESASCASLRHSDLGAPTLQGAVDLNTGLFDAAAREGEVLSQLEEA